MENEYLPLIEEEQRISRERIASLGGQESVDIKARISLAVRYLKHGIKGVSFKNINHQDKMELNRFMVWCELGFPGSFEDLDKNN